MLAQNNGPEEQLHDSVDAEFSPPHQAQLDSFDYDFPETMPLLGMKSKITFPLALPSLRAQHLLFIDFDLLPDEGHLFTNQMKDIVIDELIETNLFAVVEFNP